MNKHERMNEQIKKHGDNLKVIFDLSEHSGDYYARQIHRLENKAHKLATDYCNGENGVTTENWDELTEKILVKVDKILNFKKKNIPVFVNGDARGYALKIKDEYVSKNNLQIHKDWGGYGIIAPEFDGN